MKRIVLITLVLAWRLGIVSAQANYPEAAEKFKRYFNQQQADSLFAMYSPIVKAALPLDKTKEISSQLHAQYGNITSLEVITRDAASTSYKATFTKGVLLLILALNDSSQLEGLRFMPYEDKKESGTDYNLERAGVTVSGTLTLPPGNKAVPVVLLIAGSGPTDRDGNNPLGVKGNTYKMLAAALLENGIACVRYDKRGIGASSPADESQLTLDTLTADAVAYVQQLKKDKRFSSVIIAGHSEGSLIGILAAAQGKADKFISIAGAGEQADVMLKRQISQNAPGSADKIFPLLDSLKKGHPVQEPGGPLNALFRSSVQPYMSSWLKYDPQTEIKKLSIPVLIIQGTTDLQVAAGEAALLKKAYPAATLTIIDEMNHVLKDAPADPVANMATYGLPALPLKPGLVTAIKDFILTAP
ncbi:alpha/beta fold hydrolase [Chitinophaga solisilvae]|uniref:alpha/beta fold hydrolase n=1 Tax=Chitinophaga solisilvae TaxID=1233460 RepID=UPI001372223D|nr:alpha/beta fold hydrolase [Chitinophaga solisilvae]